MKRIIFCLILLCNAAFSQAGMYYLTQDTTVTGTWNLSGNWLKVSPGVKIHGSGTILNYYLDAYYNQNIFDTTLDFSGIRGSINGNRVSAIWFGASTSNANNVRYFQRGIDACVNKGFTFYIPSGTYIDSGAIYIRSYDGNGNFQVSQLSILGDYVMNCGCLGTVIKDYSKLSCALGIQYGKGCSVSGLYILGKWTPPSMSNLTAYYNLTFNQFMDSTCSAYYCGIATDPQVSSSTSGSTGIVIENCYIGGFTTDIFITANQTSLNNELVTIRFCSLGNSRSCITSTQAQEKLNVIENCMAWESCWCFISIGHTQTGTAGYYVLNDINVAGGCVNPFFVNISGWFGFSVNNFYAESVASLGTITTDGAPVSMSNIRVQLVDSSIVGAHYIATTNSKAVIWRDCFFTYFDGRNDHVLPFNGISTFDNCTFGGLYKNQVTGSIFYPNCTFRN